MRKSILQAAALLMAVSVTSVSAETCIECVQRELAKADALPRAGFQTVCWGVGTVLAGALTGGTGWALVGCFVVGGATGGAASLGDNAMVARSGPCAYVCLPAASASASPSDSPLPSATPQYAPPAFDPGVRPVGPVVLGDPGFRQGGRRGGSSSSSTQQTQPKSQKHGRRHKQTTPQAQHVKQRQVKLQRNVCPPNKCRR